MDGRTAWLWFTVSFSTLVVSLTMVLAFMLWLVVPSLEVRTLHSTQCLVHAITLPCTSGRCTIQNGQDCVKVQVLYNPPGRKTPKLGYLVQAHRRLQDGYSNTSQPHHKCFCGDCSLSQPPEENSSNMTVGVQVSDWHEPLRPGDLLKCYHTLSSTNHNNNRIALHQSWVLFNAMFWPTLLFICGFVGVFFSCISLAKEDWTFSRRRHHTQFKMTITSSSDLL